MAENDLVLRFVVALLKIEETHASERDLQAALQTFTNELGPWVSPADLDLPPRYAFSMFDSLDMTEDDRHSVTLSPEGVALFRAWLRRQGIDPLMSHS